MRLVIQRVSQAQVEVEGRICGSIQRGYLVFFGVGKEDTKAHVDKYMEKMANLRIMEDEEGKTNQSLKDVGGSVLLVSQFTLYANCKKGNRPSFTKAASIEKGKELYLKTVDYAVKSYDKDRIKTGVFQAHMEVEYINDGPITILLDSEKKF